MANAHCMACGAPDDGESVLCKYCQRAVSPEAQASAIPCPRCRTLCRWGKQKCASCQTWIVVACVFCGAISPHNQQACLACHETFAGAVERKQQRAQQQSHQQSMQTFGAVGNIAASFLGAAAGAAVGSHDWGGGGRGGSYGHHSAWSSDSDTFVNNTSEDPPIGAWSESQSSDWSGSNDTSGSSDYSGGDDSSIGDFSSGNDE